MHRHTAVDEGHVFPRRPDRRAREQAVHDGAPHETTTRLAAAWHRRGPRGRRRARRARRAGARAMRARPSRCRCGSEQTNSVSVRRQARLSAAITLPLDVTPRDGQRIRDTESARGGPACRRSSRCPRRPGETAPVVAAQALEAGPRVREPVEHGHHEADARCCAHSPGLALVDRDVRGVRGARVLRARPDQPVVGVLLHDVRRPADDPAHRENRRELVGRRCAIE